MKDDEITVCTDDFESGEEFELEVEFESNPKPTKVKEMYNILPSLSTYVIKTSDPL